MSYVYILPFDAVIIIFEFFVCVIGTLSFFHSIYFDKLLSLSSLIPPQLRFKLPSISACITFVFSSTTKSTKLEKK